jgi:serine/threonine protein kinase
MTDPLLESRLGQYQALRVLGRGGMGVVYEAEDLTLRRRVALKVLAPTLLGDTSARARFQREIEHAVAIEHPHVVPVYAAGFEPPHFYIAMRMIDGPDLARILSNQGAFEEGRALRLLGQVASALQEMHGRGLVHRDVKPHNILLWAAGTDDEHSMLADFGIAKAIHDSVGLTGLGPLGTPAYMAPEVCMGRAATPASDQYSLGCTSFEMLSGRLPFAGDALSLRAAHVEEEPLDLREIAPQVSETVSAAVMRALQKNPAERHSSVRDLVVSARGSLTAFQRSEAISGALTAARNEDEAVAGLSGQGLSDASISHILDVDRATVVRLRRRAARRALVGRRGTFGETDPPTEPPNTTV